MKIKEIQELVNFISESGLEEVNIETENFKISVKQSPKQNAVPVTPIAISVPAPASLPPAQSVPPVAQASSDTTGSHDFDSNLVEIKSPMIGTFYRSSNPESPAFVEIGSTVKSGDPVCIIEAMKLFNEIESEISGKIVKVLVDNSQPVEYDQPLFLVDPS